MAWLVSRLIPKHQHTLPRRWFILGALFFLSTLTVVPILQAGFLQGVVASGDSAILWEREARVIVPIYSEDPFNPEVVSASREGFDRLRDAYHAERQSVDQLGLAAYGVTVILAGGLIDAVRTVVTLGRTYVSSSQVTGDFRPNDEKVRESWGEARPEMRLLIHRRIVVTFFMSGVYAAGISLAGLLLVIVSWTELRRGRIGTDGR